ncbi:MAG: tetratricopeptide repeat protein [Anaerolineae bacterium]|jgi:tetratricopeptide (TPR) repeat protein
MTIGQRLRRWRAQVDGLARRAWPREAEDFLARGLDRHLKGDLVGAIADYDRAIAGYPDRQSRAMAYLMRGNVRRDEGDLAGAIEDYDRSIALHPGQAGAHLNRALACEEAGERARARADYGIVGELSADPGWRREAAEGLERLEGEG